MVAPSKVRHLDAMSNYDHSRGYMISSNHDQALALTTAARNYHSRLLDSRAIQA